VEPELLPPPHPELPPPVPTQYGVPGSKQHVAVYEEPSAAMLHDVLVALGTSPHGSRSSHVTVGHVLLGSVPPPVCPAPSPLDPPDDPLDDPPMAPPDDDPDDEPDALQLMVPERARHTWAWNVPPNDVSCDALAETVCAFASNAYPESARQMPPTYEPIRRLDGEAAPIETPS